MNLNDEDTLIRLLDQALSSKEESVKNLLQSLLVTVSLVHAEDRAPQGPIVDLLDTVTKLQDQVASLNSMTTALCQRLDSLESRTTKIASIQQMSQIVMDKYNCGQDAVIKKMYDHTSPSSEYTDLLKKITARMKNNLK